MTDTTKSERRTGRKRKPGSWCVGMLVDYLIGLCVDWLLVKLLGGLIDRLAIGLIGY